MQRVCLFLVFLWRLSENRGVSVYSAVGLSGGIASKLVKPVASFLLCELVLYTATLDANFKPRCRVTFLHKKK